MRIKERSSRKSRLSRSQRDFLNTCFETNSSPNAQERAYIASQSLVSEERVRNWFQNRRARERGDWKASPCLNIIETSVFEGYDASKVHPTSNDLYIRR